MFLSNIVSWLEVNHNCSNWLKPLKIDGTNDVSWLFCKSNHFNWLNPLKRDGTNVVSWLEFKCKYCNRLKPVNVPVDIDVIWRDHNSRPVLNSKLGYHAANWFLSRTTPWPLCALSSNRPNIKKLLDIFFLSFFFSSSNRIKASFCLYYCNYK
jgi:hypothetical protein